MSNPVSQNTLETLAHLRKDYSQSELDESSVDPVPLQQLRLWLSQALEAKLPEPNAMTLATVGTDGRPKARIVLIKAIDDRGISFFTNYESSKGHELAAHPFASLQFFWVELERQVRIEGRVEKLSDAMSDEYFHQRPLASRIGAWASPQSSVIPNREWLETRERKLTAELGQAPARPAHWGGYLVVPDLFEFWQGRPSRLHDRVRYRLVDSNWIIERLAP
jgi:pyridoxamine 5'-phosphate oxidase